MLLLMMEKGYSPRGWLGLIMGTRLWYPFYSCKSDDEATFEKKVDAVVREISPRRSREAEAQRSAAAHI
jgi:hypothetical protein